jgi:hypothetical protein
MRKSSHLRRKRSQGDLQKEKRIRNSKFGRKIDPFVRVAFERSVKQTLNLVP